MYKEKTMPINDIKCKTSTGGLVFYPRTTAGAPTVLAQYGISAGINSASSNTSIYGYIKHITTALTGTSRAVRGNAWVNVASSAGTVEGVFGRVSNATSASATDGVALGTARGISALVAGAGTATISNAQAIYGQLDIDSANLTVSDARGIYINVQSGASATLTACNLAYLEYESVSGTAPAINSALKIATVGGVTGATYLIDAATFNLALHDTDQVSLLRFRDAAGTVVTMSYDTSDTKLVFA